MTIATADQHVQIASAVRQYWGFDSLRPLQRESIDAALAGRDSLTVLPTGGGKSLCFQVPPLVTGRLTVVVSPLIALMKDQVDGLTLAGYPAAAVHSNVTPAQHEATREKIRTGTLRLLMVAPERLLAGSFLSWLKSLKLGAIAIDEAHCISQWGHDFRPEYRRLAELRDHLPGIPINAYTATATPRVREDIVAQLHLKNPAVLVGTFDRPNLTYRVLPRVDRSAQIEQAVRRHPDAAAIVYCISRNDTETVAADLNARGLHAAAYHAGLDAPTRTKISEDFKSERLDVVVATVAFGMGIDRSDVRLVVHAAMPKTIEHYQQETGRAGRDGLPAECLLLYSAADVAKWRQIMTRSAEENATDPQVLSAQFQLLDHMQRTINSSRCRHRALSEYFGQAYPSNDCGACDCCLKELASIPDAHPTAQKILSAVARCGQNLGARHIIDVLTGKATPRVLERGHDQLPTFGILRSLDPSRIASYIDQLIDAGDLQRHGDEYPVLRLTATSGQILKGTRQATLVEATAITDMPARRGKRRRGVIVETPALSADEQALFEVLRGVRRTLAEQLSVPPYVIFADTTLEELAGVRPSTRESFINVRGVGTRKLEQFAAPFLTAIATFCRERGLAVEAREGSRPRTAPEAPIEARPASDPRTRAADLFSRGLSIEDVSRDIGRAASTTADYLVEFIETRKPESIGPWIDQGTYDRVAEAFRAVGQGRLKPVFDHLQGEVTYNQIRIVAAHRRALQD